MHTYVLKLFIFRFQKRVYVCVCVCVCACVRAFRPPPVSLLSLYLFDLWSVTQTAICTYICVIKWLLLYGLSGPHVHSAAGSSENVHMK